MSAAPILAPVTVTVTTRVIHKRPFVMPPPMAEGTDPYFLSERIEPPNMPKWDTRPCEPCDKCAYDFWRIVKELPDDPHNPFASTANSFVVKVKGEPCHRCRDNSPPGTWHVNWPKYSRVSGDGKSHDGQKYSYIRHAP